MLFFINSIMLKSIFQNGTILRYNVLRRIKISFFISFVKCTSLFQLDNYFHFPAISCSKKGFLKNGVTQDRIVLYSSLAALSYHLNVSTQTRYSVLNRRDIRLFVLWLEHWLWVTKWTIQFPIHDWMFIMCRIPF